MTKPRTKSVEHEAATTTHSTARISLVPTAAVAVDASPSSELRAAQALSPAEVLRFPGDALGAYRNLLDTRDVLIAHRAEIDARVPQVDWALVAKTERVGQAMLEHVREAERDDAKPVKPDLDALSPLRAVIASDARTQVIRGTLPASAVRAALRARGDIARASAVIELVALYKRHADEIGARTAVTAAELDRAGDLAESLLPRLTPRRVRRRKSVTRAQRVALRDRFWTLAVQHQQALERIAGAMWGADVRKMIPSLRARSVVRRRAVAPVVTPPSPTG